MKAPRCKPDIRAKAIHELLSSDGGADQIRKLAQAVVDKGDTGLGLNTMVREAMKPTWGGALMQIRINGLLSSPKTHAANILGNSIVAAMAVPERALAAGFSKAFHGGEITMGEVAAQSFGLVQGVKDGMRLMTLGKKAEGDEQVQDLFAMFRPTENMHTDHLTPELFGVDNGAALGTGLAYAGKAINVPTAMLGKADDFFKSVGYRMELNALAHRTATSEGLEGEAFIARMQDIKNNPPDDISMEAFDAARYQTFTNDLGKIGTKLQTAINSNYATKFVIPFVRTPTNILKYTFERTPLALASSAIRADIRAGGTRAATAQARIALGSTLLMMGGQMALSGRVTGNGSLNENQKKIARQSGWQPYSIKIGDRYYAYNRLEPLGTLLGLGADIAEMSGGLDADEQENVILAASMALAKNMASKTYLSGVFDFMAAFDDGNFHSDIDKYVVNQSFTFAPFSSLIRQTARATDPIIRDSKALEGDAETQLIMEFVNSWRKNIPGMSDELPERRDLWGEVINQSSGFGMLYDMASPIATRIHDPDPIEQAILDNEVSISWPRREIQGVKLTPEQYSRYSEVAGKLAKENLSNIVGTPSFNGLSDGAEGMKAQIIQRMVGQSRKIAANQMLQEFDGLQEKIMQLKLEKVKKLTGN